MTSDDGLKCNQQKLLVSECASESVHGLRPDVRLRAEFAVLWSVSVILRVPALSVY